jgi:hypothetical protein
MLSPLLLPVQNPYINPPSSRRPPSSCRRPAMTAAFPYPKGSPFDDVLVHRLRELSIPSRPQSPSQASPSISLRPSSPNTGGSGCFLESPFTYSWPEYRKESQNEYPLIIDSFAPHRPSFDLSPTSSASSDLDQSTPRSSLDVFFATQSRVIRVSTAFI